MTCQTATSATIDFMPTLDASVVGTNTSASIRYDSNSTSGAVGIPDASVPSYSDTFFFADGSTGIEFQFDITWTASPTSGGPVEFLDGDSNSLGVGTSGSIQDTETLTVAVSNLSVGFDNYISGSVGGITNPQLDSSSVSLHDVTFDDRDYGILGLLGILPGPNQSLIDITSGGSTVTWGDDAGEWGSGNDTFEFGTDGLTTSESTVLLEHNSTALGDLDFTLASTSFRVSANISQGTVTAVPEPSSFALLGVAMLCGFTRRKRRRAN
ncbi:PEP-CTERM sorting domain-containing protein [Stieleria marina]